VGKRHLSAVAEGLGNERRRALEAELTDSTVPGTVEVDTEVAETVSITVFG
jgi:hypothetical protein